MQDSGADSAPDWLTSLSSLRSSPCSYGPGSPAARSLSGPRSTRLDPLPRGPRQSLESFLQLFEPSVPERVPHRVGIDPWRHHLLRLRAHDAVRVPFRQAVAALT